MAMSYDDLEVSVDAGRPIELFRFIMSNGLTWYYTSADQDITAAGFLFRSAAISRDSIKQTGEYATDALQLTVPSSIGPAQIYMTSPPSRPINVTIGEKHADSDEIVIGYIGEISQVNFPFPGRAVMTCESLASTFAREGLRLGWQRTCPYALFDPVTCKLDKASRAIAFTVLTIDGFDITVDLATSQDTGQLDGGFIEWNHPIRGIEFLAIESHEELTTGEANARIKLFTPPGELFEGATGNVFPGCNFTPARCQEFGNYDNYGGHPDMPGKSPFDGDPVF